MGTALTILLALLVFGFLIFIHEFGHYATARLFKVSITEFSIGMGPKLVTYTSKKTNIQYSLGMFPIGGYVAMVGEDEDSDDPNAFNKKPAWQRFIITAAGATVNIVVGFLAMIIITASINIGNTTVAQFSPATDFSAEEGYVYSSTADSDEVDGLLEGDTITHVNGKRVKILDELHYEIMRNGNAPIDLTVTRNGETLLLDDLVFTTFTDQGQVYGIMDFRVYAIEKGFFDTLSISFRKACLVMRMCWEAIYDLITGRYTVAAVSGPVGISTAIGEAVSVGTFLERVLSLLNITVIISINLGFMNLLPIPALDGGRIVVILIEMITRKKLPAKVEGIINGVGLALLLLLSVVIMIKDVIQLF